MVLVLFSSHRIFQSADCVLHLACSLVGLAFSFQLLVAEDLPGGFFDSSLGLHCRTFDSIFIHCRILAVCWGANGASKALFQIAWFWGNARLAHCAPCQLTFEHNRSDAPV